MSKRYIFARRQPKRRAPAMIVAIVALFGLAVWASIANDPTLPPIYLQAAPMEMD